MEAQRGERETALRELVEIGPEVVERMALEDDPSAAMVASYVLTRGASRAWEAINGHLTDGSDAFFWITGSAGSGKTHFLNYVLALNARAGAVNVETARYFTHAIEVSGDASAAEIERRILEAIGAALTGEDQTPALWRQLRGGEAFGVALDSMRRQGVKGITIALDLGECSSAPAGEVLAKLAAAAHTLRNLRVVLLAACRSMAPREAQAFDVALQDGEELPVAIGRARRLDDVAARRVERLYRGLDLGPWDARAIYPLHPLSANMLMALHARGERIAKLALAVRQALEPWFADRDFNRLLVPGALMRSATVRHAVEARLGANGRAALKMVQAASRTIDTDGRAQEIAHALVETLVLDHLYGQSVNLPLDQLRSRLSLPDHTGRGAGTPELKQALTVLAARSRGIVVYDRQAETVGFNPHGAGAAEVAMFNAALALVRCFDPDQTALEDLRDLKERMKRLGAAMAAALEHACVVRDTLEAALNEDRARLSAAHERALAEFIGMAEGGPAMLIEAGAKPSSRDAALATIAAYETLALAAGAVPRLQTMNGYLLATGLLFADSEDSAEGREVSALATQCQVLAPLLRPAALLNASLRLEVIEERFQKFKWSYVEHYRAAHEQARLERERLLPIAADARRHLEALDRLNAIAALGDGVGAEPAARMAALESHLLPCDFAGVLAPEVTPCCVRCGFRLGTPSPRDDLGEIFAGARRALEIKLAMLSQQAIARIIRQHDLNHRLEGFLKIIQAAQTDALVRVLDDQLAAYLGRLLEENLAGIPVSSSGSAEYSVVRKRRESPLRGSKIGGNRRRDARGGKTPPEGH